MQPSPEHAPQSPPSPPKRQLPMQPSPVGFIPVPQPSLQPTMSASVSPRQPSPSPSASHDMARNISPITTKRRLDDRMIHRVKRGRSPTLNTNFRTTYNA